MFASTSYTESSFLLVMIEFRNVILVVSVDSMTSTPDRTRREVVVSNDERTGEDFSEKEELRGTKSS